VALSSHLSKSDPQAGRFSRLERDAKQHRTQTGYSYSHSLLAEESEVPEEKFEAWMAGDAVLRDDQADLMAVVSLLALWAGQPQPDPRKWPPRATRKRLYAIMRKLGGWLNNPKWSAPLITTIVGGLVVWAVSMSQTSDGSQPSSAESIPSVPFGYPVSRTNGDLSQCGTGWLFQRPIQEIKYTSLQGQDVATDEIWALHNGASDVNGGAYTIALQGYSATENVAIHDVRIKVLSRKPARAATAIYNSIGCGGALQVEDFTVQVDSPNPQLVAQNGATQFPYTISGTDIEYLVLDAATSPSDRDEYQFVYQIDWSQGSRQGTVTVMAPNGKPFTAAPVLPGSNTYYDGNGRWASGG
jgi:hypothetical protein